MWSQYENVPYRQIGRIIVTYRTDAIRRTLPLVGNDLTTVNLLMAVVKAHLIQQREPAGLQARITASAIARSLGRPHQTLHRHARALVGLGLCSMEGHRIDPAPHPALDAWLGGLRDGAVTAFELRRLSGVLLPRRGDAASDELEREIGIFALAMSLSAVEYHAQENANWTEIFITGMVLRNNVGVLTGSFAEHRHFGMDVPPAELRQPLPLRELAQMLALPYSSLARHVARLVARGQLERSGDGVLVSPQWLQRPEVIEHMLDSVKYIGRRLLTLQAHGFDFVQPTRHLAGSEPKIAAIAVR